MEDIIALRHELHQHPEVSNQEFATSERIHAFITKLAPDKCLQLASTGRAYVFESGKPGKTVLFRAELDALRITENSDLPYCSQNKGVGHLCGHDGHMAILAALAKKIALQRPRCGRTVLLFQPAEELEQGARDVVNDSRFSEIEPDYVFALHNIPGKPTGEILFKHGSFAAASQGLSIKLIGKNSHAAEPENGINPDKAISRIINGLHGIRANKELFKDLSLLTIIHIKLGEIAFGTSPGYAEMHFTLRAFENEDMEILCQETESIIKRIAQEEQLLVEMEYSEVFPATENHPDCVDMICSAAKEEKLPCSELEHPFKWSEDFAYYAQKYKAGFFGLGAGTGHAALHHSNYDFPDEIINTGAKVFFSIYKKINLT